MGLILRFLSAGLSSACFGMIYQIRGKKLLYAGICGEICFIVYSLFENFSPVYAAFLASCAITFYSESMARVQKTPATVFLVAGMIPIVPGSGMYYCMYQALEGNLAQSAVTCYETLLIAGAIAIGIVTVSSFFKLAHSIRKRRRQV